MVLGDSAHNCAKLLKCVCNYSAVFILNQRALVQTWSSVLAKKYNTNHHELMVDSNVTDILPSLINYFGEPFADSSFIPTFLISKAIRSDVTVALSGDGGDELFGGYVFRYKKYLSLVSKESSTIEKIKAYLACHERDWIVEQEKIFTEKADFRWSQIYSILDKFFDNDLTLLDQVFLADFNGKLRYNMTPLYKKIHDNFGISYKAPILNKELLYFSSKLEDRKSTRLNFSHSSVSRMPSSA